MGELSEAAIEKLKADHSGHELRLVKCPDDTELVVKSPDKTVYNMFMSDVTNEKKDKAVSMEAYAKRCVVYPDRALVDTLFMRYPAFPANIAGLLNEMAGNVGELDSKKL
jgi:hypothetical protein